MSGLPPPDITVMQSFEIFQQVDEMERYMRSQIMFVDDECIRSAKRRKELQGQVHEFLADTRDQVMAQQRHVTGLEMELEKERYKNQMLAEQFEREQHESTKIHKTMVTMSTVLGAMQTKLTQNNKETVDAQHAQVLENEARAKQMLESNTNISTQLQDLVESQQAMTKAIEETLPEQLNLTFKQIIQVISNEAAKNSSAQNTNGGTTTAPGTTTTTTTTQATPQQPFVSPTVITSSPIGALSPSVIPVLDASSANTTLPAFATTEPVVVSVAPVQGGTAPASLLTQAPTATASTTNTTSDASVSNTIPVSTNNPV